jgi:hypothetical protein
MECANSKGNDRPHWGTFMHINQWANSPTPDQVEMVKRAQGYLSDLGDALIAEGMLSK